MILNRPHCRTGLLVLTGKVAFPGLDRTARSVVANPFGGDVQLSKRTVYLLIYPTESPADKVLYMNNHQAQAVWQYVRDYRRSQNGQMLDGGKLQHVDQIAQQLRTDAGLAELAEDDLQVGIALSWFGPTDAGVPPATLREDILDLFRQDVPDEETRRARRTEIIIAYGCGNWRQILKGGGSWEHRWPRALNWVTQHVRGWIKATAAWLHFEVQLKGYAFVAPFPSRETAETLANFLWLGSCDCWRARLSDPAQEVDHRTAQRRARCHREHDLSAWNPSDMALVDFIARAVKGDKIRGDRSGRKGFASGAVFQGMFFGDLYRENDIRRGRVLIWCCPQHPDLVMESAHCLPCDDSGAATLFDETRHRRDVVTRLLVKAPTGPYQDVQYWHCQEGDTYYQLPHPVCPLCHRHRTQGAAKSTVWILSPTRRVEESSVLPTSSVDQSDPDTRLMLTDVLKQLSPLEREVVMLVHVQEVPKRQAAQRLSISTEQLNDELENALEKMRELLTQDD